MADGQIIAKYVASSKAADTPRDHANLSGESLSKMVASVWNEAQARYLALRHEYPSAGPEISNFDNAWNIRTTNCPPPTDPEALVYANRALSFYKKGGIAAAAEHSQGLRSRLAYANRALPAYWMIGTELARLAASIEATQPISPQRQLAASAEVSIGTEDELNKHIDLLEAELAKITAAIKAVRTETAS